MQRKVAKPVEACAVCKRPAGAPHDESFCTPERRHAAGQPEPANPSPLIVRYVVSSYGAPSVVGVDEPERIGKPTEASQAASRARGLEAMNGPAPCVRCQGESGAEHSTRETKRGTWRDQICKACRVSIMKASRSAWPATATGNAGANTAGIKCGQTAPGGGAPVRDALVMKPFPDAAPPAGGTLRDRLAEMEAERERIDTEIATLQAVLAMPDEALAAHLERASRAVALAEQALWEKTHAAA